MSALRRVEAGRPAGMQPVLEGIGRLARLRGETEPPLALGDDLRALEPGASVQERRRVLRLVADRCQALMRAIEAPPVPSATRRNAARIHAILSRPEFRPSTASQSWWARLSRWIMDRIARLLSRLGIPDARGTRTAVALAGIAALLAALTWAALSVSRRLRNALQAEPARALVYSQTAPAPEDLLRAAVAHAQAGRFREALERAYVATLFHLQASGHLRLDLRRTNWENLRALQTSIPQDARDSLQEATRLFERKWYGMEECSEPEFRRGDDLLARVREAASSTPTGRPAGHPAEAAP